MPPRFDVKNIDFLSVMDNIDEGIIITDRLGIIRFYNQTQAKIDGLDPEYAIGRKVTDIYELSGDTSLIMLSLQLGKPIRNRTFFYKTVFGKVANTIHSTFPIIQHGQVEGVICFVKDYNILKSTTPVHSLPDYRPQKGNGTRYSFSDIVGQNHELLRTLNTARAASDSGSPIMLIGETGTGKELFAQAIHNQSKRSNKPFIAVNCAAIPENLLEGLLFGTTRGAFTGAVDKPGLFEQANGSTLYLDELLSMPLSLQAKLLRVLQEKKVRRIGSTKEISLNAKIVSSVSRPPRDAIQENELRTDLFYRIGVVMVRIPPLRERLDDLAPLVSHFILKLNNSLGTNVHSLSNEVMDLFLNYGWPGNIRELEHLLEGAHNIAGYDEILELRHFSPAFEHLGSPQSSRIFPSLPSLDTKTRPTQQKNLTETVKSTDLLSSQALREKNTLRNVLQQTGGNVSRASRLLGISRQLLHYKMKKHGLARSQFLSP